MGKPGVVKGLILHASVEIFTSYFIGTSSVVCISIFHVMIGSLEEVGWLSALFEKIYTSRNS